MEKVTTTLENILKLVVNNPEDVEMHVSQEKDDHGELEVINVKVHREDVGICIGVGGATAEAIRKVVGIVGFKQTGKRVYVRIDAPRLPKQHFEFPEQK